jgi:hypothetical protein
MYLKKPSFRQTDSSPSWTHKSDSLPNFGVNSNAGRLPRCTVEEPAGYKGRLPACGSCAGQRLAAGASEGSRGKPWAPAGCTPNRGSLHLPWHLLYLTNPPLSPAWHLPRRSSRSHGRHGMAPRNPAAGHASTPTKPSNRCVVSP